MCDGMAGGAPIAETGGEPDGTAQDSVPAPTAAPQATRDPAASPRRLVRAQIVHGIADGSLAVGAALPSVRELAARSGVAAMTVSKVYSELREGGLVESRPGSGTYVADSALARVGAHGPSHLWSNLDALLDHAGTLGLAADDLMSLVEARAEQRRRTGPPTRLVMVGLFSAATRSYAACVAAQLGELASVVPVVLGTEPGPVDPSDAAAIRRADMILTFEALEPRIAALDHDAPVVSLRFIPAESTRRALASIDPLARVAVVSRFADYLPVLEMGVRRFAPHVGSVVATDMSGDDVAAAVAACEVLVLSTGAEAAGALAPREAVRIEYRHVPDPADVDRLVRPRLRAAPAPVATPPAAAPTGTPRTGPDSET